MSLKNKRGIALIACYLVIVVLTILGSAFLVRSVGEKRIAERERDSIQAFWLAEAGIDKAIWYLTRTSADAPDTAPDGSIDGIWRTTAYPAPHGDGLNDPKQETLSAGAFSGTYTIWVQDSGSNVRIYSRGTVDGLTRTITQTLAVSGSAGPAPFDYATYVGGAIHDGGLSSSGGEGQIEGQGTSELPTVDFAYYQGLAAQAGADHSISGANLTFAGGTEGNRAEYSGVWYVESTGEGDSEVGGNVIIGSHVNITGAIIATGNIDIKNAGNITISASPSYPAIVSQGNFQAQSSTNIIINGLVYVGEDLDGNLLAQQSSDITITGTLIVAGNFNLQQSSTMTVTYDASATQNLEGFSGGSGGVSVTPQKDWQEI